MKNCIFLFILSALTITCYPQGYRLQKLQGEVSVLKNRQWEKLVPAHLGTCPLNGADSVSVAASSFAWFTSDADGSLFKLHKPGRFSVATDFKKFLESDSKAFYKYLLSCIPDFKSKEVDLIKAYRRYFGNTGLVSRGAGDCAVIPVDGNFFPGDTLLFSVWKCGGNGEVIAAALDIYSDSARKHHLTRIGILDSFIVLQKIFKPGNIYWWNLDIAKLNTDQANHEMDFDGVFHVLTNKESLTIKHNIDSLKNEWNVSPAIEKALIAGYMRKLNLNQEARKLVKEARELCPEETALINSLSSAKGGAGN